MKDSFLRELFMLVAKVIKDWSLRARGTVYKSNCYSPGDQVLFTNDFLVTFCTLHTL